MNIDLHVHSKFSKRPTQWVLRKIGCPESFTEPLQIYRIARRRGMDLVTISDHNSIAGALEIAHLPGAFVSEEITTYFPEDGCKLHVLALDVTEAQHDEIQKLRKNVFELVPWLRDQGILHILAHPLYAVNDRLTLDHFEQALLLFKCFELNGARNG
ncbi:MAG: PHP domain-containing protein, partial [Desulfococcaceae bacterium]